MTSQELTQNINKADRMVYMCERMIQAGDIQGFASYHLPRYRQQLSALYTQKSRWSTPYTGRPVMTTQGPITHTRTVKGAEGLEVWGTADFQSEIHLSTTYHYQLSR